MSNLNQYHQPIAFHPGETLREKLEELKMTPREFAVRTGKPEKTIHAVLSGKSSITPEMAVLFEHVLSIPAHMWLSLQSAFDEYVARSLRSRELQKSVEWARNFPFSEMVKKGWLPTCKTMYEKTEALCEFFGMSGEAAWTDYYLNQELKVAFRISLSHAKEPHAISAWLRQGELQAAELSARPYDEAQFKQALSRVQSIISINPHGMLQQIQSICLEAGVVVVYTPCIKKAPVNGCARWLNDTPLIQLSDRYKRNDVFWFTFFHEAGHILLHGKKDIFLEDGDYTGQDSKKEAEADRFAVKWTLTLDAEAELDRRTSATELEIKQLATRFNTHPAFIVGRLWRDKKIPHTVGRRFITPIDLDSIQ
jgi:addiction module HigA family antidote